MQEPQSLRCQYRLQSYLGRLQADQWQQLSMVCAQILAAQPLS
jgi:hypothetical protein